MIMVILLYIVGAVLVFLLLLRIVRKYYKFPAPAFFGRLVDSRWRIGLQRPEQIIDRSGIKRNMRVMEIGCGPGTYTLAVARAVGPEGEVHAIDTQPAMVEMLNAALRQEQNKDITNVQTAVASPYRLPFEDGYFDAVYMIAALAEISSRQHALREIHRALKENGTLAISEFLPDPDYPFRRTVTKWCRQAGYTLTRGRGNFLDYTLQFRKTH